MLQLLQLDVAKIDMNIAYVAMTMLQVYVLNILSILDVCERTMTPNKGSELGNLKLYL
jgi:hypothetical protein